MKKNILLILLLLTTVTARAQYLRVDINGDLLFPTNFFEVNTNLWWPLLPPTSADNLLGNALDQVNTMIASAASSSNWPGAIALQIASSNLVSEPQATGISNAAVQAAYSNSAALYYPLSNPNSYQTPANVAAAIGNANSQSNWPGMSGTISTNSIEDSSLVLNPCHFPNLFGFYGTNWYTGATMAGNCFVFFLGDSHLDNASGWWKRQFANTIGLDGGFSSMSSAAGGAYTTNVTYGHSFCGSLAVLPVANASIILDADGLGGFFGPCSRIIIPYNQAGGMGTFKIEVWTNGAAGFGTLVSSISSDNGGALNVAFTNLTVPRGYYKVRLTSVTGSNEMAYATFLSKDGYGVVPLSMTYGGTKMSDWTNANTLLMRSNYFQTFQPRLLLWQFADVTNEWIYSAPPMLGQFKSWYTNFDTLVISEPPASNEVDSATGANTSLTIQLERAFCLASNLVFFDEHKSLGSWNNGYLAGLYSPDSTGFIHLNAAGMIDEVKSAWEYSGLSALNLGRDLQNNRFKVSSANGTDASYGIEAAAPSTNLRFSLIADTNSTITIAFEGVDGAARAQIVSLTNGVIRFVDGNGNTMKFTSLNTSTAMEIHGNAGSGDPGSLVKFSSDQLSTPGYFGIYKRAGVQGWQFGDQNGSPLGIWSVMSGTINGTPGYVGLGGLNSGHTNPFVQLDVFGATRLRQGIIIDKTNGTPLNATTPAFYIPVTNANDGKVALLPAYQ